MPHKDPNRRREYHRLRAAKKRDDFFRDKSCARCGTTEHLELDHIDPSEKVSHRIWQWSAARRNEELEKCQVLCRPCHWSKTLVDMGWAHGHGSMSMYNHFKCRCDRCKQKNREVKAEQRKLIRNSTAE